MNFSFAEALQQLGDDGPFRIANAARPPARYLFNTLLPERTRPSYHVESGTMTVRSLMAGLVGMDSPYPPGGVIELSTFLEQSAKIGNDVTLSEKAIRDLQRLLQVAQDRSGGRDLVVQTALNFLNKVVIQPHLDTFEWLRGQALVTGAIDWTFNQKKLEVDYGIPAAHLFATRTTASGDAYGAAGSLFWADLREARRLLKYNLRVAITHPDTLDEIVFNDANNLEIIGQGEMSFTVRRLIGNNERPARDVRDTVTLFAYGEEGEVRDPANPGQTVLVPFMPRGKILFVGQNSRSGFRVGEGATDDVEGGLELGHTHIAPTVEGGGLPGRWSRLFVPEERPWQLTGQAVTNGLPVIENAEKIVVASTELAS